jgi:hypothetical protein
VSTVPAIFSPQSQTNTPIRRPSSFPFPGI